MKFRNSIEIKEPSDWELVGCDVLDEFLSDFTEKKGLTREVEEEEEEEDEIYFDDSVSYMYTQRGMELYYRMESRLNKLGNKIFPNESFSYNPSNIIMT